MMRILLLPESVSEIRIFIEYHFFQTTDCPAHQRLWISQPHLASINEIHFCPVGCLLPQRRMKCLPPTSQRAQKTGVILRMDPSKGTIGIVLLQNPTLADIQSSGFQAGSGSVHADSWMLLSSPRTLNPTVLQTHQPAAGSPLSHN